MEKVNLRDLWKISKEANEPLLGDSTSLAGLDFMDEYLDNYAKLDRQLILEKGFFFPIWNTQYEEDAEDVLDQFQDDAAGYIWKNKESYQRIFDVLSADYEPLWNYDKTSTITDQESGTDETTRDIGARHTEDNFAQRQNTNQYGAVSHTDTIGQRQDTQLYGQKQLSTLYGARSESDTIGAINNSDIHGAKSGTSENEIAGFNATGYVDADKTTTNENTFTDQHTESQRTNGHTAQSYTDTLTDTQHTDTLTQGQQSNTHGELAHSDTLTQGAHKDEHDENAARDTDHVTYGHKNTHNERTTGNIGVMSTQDLINQELELRLAQRFYDILFNDIVKNLCSYFDEGYDCF